MSTVFGDSQKDLLEAAYLAYELVQRILALHSKETAKAMDEIWQAVMLTAMEDASAEEQEILLGKMVSLHPENPFSN